MTESCGVVAFATRSAGSDIPEIAGAIEKLIGSRFSSLGRFAVQEHQSQVSTSGGTATFASLLIKTCGLVDVAVDASASVINVAQIGADVRQCAALATETSWGQEHLFRSSVKFIAGVLFNTSMKIPARE